MIAAGDGAYFASLSAAIAQEKLFRPTLVIDRDRLDANLAEVARRIDPAIALRIVDKSLPVPDLLHHVSTRLGTARFMTFHLPITIRMLEAFPDGEFLFGKPMPVEAIAAALETASPPVGEGLVNRVVHLVDSAARLDEIAALATRIGQRLQIAFEINIGLNRGGLETPSELKSLLAKLNGNPLIDVAGVMGYEAHVPAIPALFGGAAGAQASADRRFEAFVAELGPHQRRILNTGGSKTALGYRKPHPATEVSLGSALVMPSDFDVAMLGALKPAAFIATPILKVVDAVIPGLPGLTKVMQAIGRFPRRGLFVYGGHWMADPAWPAAMKPSSLWGHSSNQQFFGTGNDSPAKVGDFAFFRPHQSEAVLQQFGAIAVFSRGRIDGYWQPFRPG